MDHNLAGRTRAVACLSASLVLNITGAFTVPHGPTPGLGGPLFDMEAIRDPSSLDAEILDDWHPVDGPPPTRQKLITIRVGEMWPGQD